MLSAHRPSFAGGRDETADFAAVLVQIKDAWNSVWEVKTALFEICMGLWWILRTRGEQRVKKAASADFGNIGAIHADADYIDRSGP